MQRCLSTDSKTEVHWELVYWHSRQNLAQVAGRTSSWYNRKISGHGITGKGGDTLAYGRTFYIRLSFTFSGNILNLLVLRRTEQIPAISRRCLLDLSSADLLVGVVSCLPCIYPAVTGTWPYGPVWCQIAG